MSNILSAYYEDFKDSLRPYGMVKDSLVKDLALHGKIAFEDFPAWRLGLVWNKDTVGIIAAACMYQVTTGDCKNEIANAIDEIIPSDHDNFIGCLFMSLYGEILLRSNRSKEISERSESLQKVKDIIANAIEDFFFNHDKWFRGKRKSRVKKIIDSLLHKEEKQENVFTLDAKKNRWIDSFYANCMDRYGLLPLEVDLDTVKIVIEHLRGKSSIKEMIEKYGNRYERHLPAQSLQPFIASAVPLLKNRLREIMADTNAKAKELDEKLDQEINEIYNQYNLRRMALIDGNARQMETEAAKVVNALYAADIGIAAAFDATVKLEIIDWTDRTKFQWRI